MTGFCRYWHTEIFRGLLVERPINKDRMEWASANGIVRTVNLHAKHVIYKFLFGVGAIGQIG
ncbi:hypothetical protein PILCRDRAFT_817899 [Piloderma croceum F 1598]|uniref:Uncharacterized protein n=1 Tax=Piloderma croceum (strain F 1598) TaxID=765440 RepID=A0A0C3BFI4_PILCF|nr:hypothetical protein PILCRDRAFT_817899 [Piloderma croceum F 1598]